MRRFISVAGWTLAVAAFFSDAAAARTPPLKSELVVDGLNFPVFVTSPPGDATRLFFLEKNSGAVRLIKNGKLLFKNFLSVWPKMVNGGERGLLGLAFHPNYAQNGWLYVHYVGLNNDVVVERYTRAATTQEQADPSTGVVLISEPQPFDQHKAGMLQFGPDGYLYVALGDGGAGYDPFNNAQKLDNLKGKILRIDVDNGTPYAIPSDNPFVATPGARGEIWAYGLRNPFRFDIDHVTGDMFIGDVGQEAREEIDFIPAGSKGLNFGWRCFEADQCVTFANCGCDPSPFVSPIHLYAHTDETCAAVIGGCVYRGCAMPSLQGTYFFSDYCMSKIWSFRYSGGVMTEFTDRTAELDPPGDLDIKKITAFGTDSRGELYWVDYADGELFKIVPDLPAGPDCNTNGVPDGCEIGAGTVSDSDGDGILDSCESALDVSPLLLGQLSTFQFSGAAAGEPVFFIFGLAGAGPGYCMNPNLCLGLAWPFDLLLTLPADPQGVAGFAAQVPPATPLVPVWFQGIVYRGAAGADSIVSNVVTHTVSPPPGP